MELFAAGVGKDLLGSCFLEDLSCSNRRQWRGRVLIAPRSLEWIPARLYLAAQVPGDTGDTADLFKMIKVRFQFSERHRIVLDGHIRRNELLSVALFDAATQIQVFRRCSPELSIPVHARPTHAVAEDEGAVLPIGSGDVVRAVADCDSLVGQRLPKITSDSVLEFIRDPRELKIGGGIAGGTPFERHDG
jgi:hypothetical protein